MGSQDIQLFLHQKPGSQSIKRVLLIPRGWDEEGDGREDQKGGDICIPMADSC